MLNQPKKLNILKKSIIFFVLIAVVALTNTAIFAQTCAVPGRNGAGTLTGVINTYFPAPTTLSSASGTSIPVGAVTNPESATTAIAAGDLLLIIQMQDATINTANTAAYGSGGAGGNGFLAGNAGFYEYAVATNAVTTAGGTIIATSPLSRTYNNDPNATTTRGKQTYQVIRVPQYTSATISGTVSAASWDGRSGGLVVFDVAGNLAMGGGTITAAARGFRGGLGRTLNGGAGTTADYRTLASINTNASKGEGIVGTQRYVWDNLLGIDTGVEGYPLGSYARGAPGNAGGGATDGDPASNANNAGGGGGSNGGAGGKGGNSFGNNLDVGGRGGAAFTLSAVNRVIMGGGGGAGTSNNGATTTSSGARGGGIVLIRAGTISGTGTINVNGENAQNSSPTCCGDGAGGGGAGGSIVVTANTPAGISGITATARGGNGGSVLVATTDHGPGGGGGGGVIMSNGSYGSTNITGGTNGTTPPTNIAYGAVSGNTGVVNTAISESSINGTSSGFTCRPRITLNKVSNVDVGAFNFTGGNGFSNQAITTTVIGTGVAGATQILTAAETSTVLTETIPGGWTLSSISCTGLGLGGTATNNLVAGTVTLDANATKGGTNIACTFTNTKLSPNLTISKTHTPTNFVRGSTGTYSITVGNMASATAATSGTITVTDTLPTGLTVNGGAAGAVATSGANGGNWTCNSNATTPQVITCTSTTAIATSGSSIFTFDVNVASNAAASVTNSVAVAGGGESTSLNGNNSATDPTPTVAPTDLTIAKSHTGDFTVGTTGNYSFTVSNAGDVASSGTITVTDTLPTGLTVNGGAVGAVTLGGAQAANWTCNSNSATPQVITCTSSTAIAGAGTSIFNFNVNVGLGTAIGTNSITNSATVSGGGDTNSANNTGTDPTTVLSPNLTLAKADTANFTVGSTGTYQMTVGNTGTAATSGTITMTDTLPTGLTVNGGAAGVVATSGANGGNWTCNSNATTPQVITCTSTTAIAVSGSSVFTFNVNVGLNTVVGTNALSNTADVAGGGEATANNGNNSGTDTTTVLSPNLAISKSHTPTTFVRGSTGTYNLTVSNSGTAATSGTITVSDTLPTGLSVNGGAAGAVATSGAQGANWTCNSNAASPQVITCTSTTAIAISGSSVFTFIVNVASNAAASVTNSVAVAGGGEATANNGNNSATDPTPTVAPTDLTIAKSHTGNFTVGTTGNYSLTVTNSGGVASSGTITIIDTLPTGLTVNGGAAGAVTIGGAQAANWTCNSNAASPQVITCTSTTAIAPAGTSIFNFNVNVGLGTAVGTNSITNSATLSGGGDMNSGNNSATDPTTVLSPNLTLAKADTANFTVGSTGTYQMTVGNTGTAATSGTITMTDALPTGLSVNGGAAGAVATSGANGGNWTCNSNAATPQVITCTSTTAIAISGSSIFTFNVNVGANTVVGTNALSNTADVAGGGEATANNGNNSSTDTTTVLSPNLTIDKSHVGDFTRNSTGTYTLTIGNSGTFATSGTITITDTLPTGLSVNGGAAGAVATGGANGGNWTCNSNAASPQVITCISTTAIAISGSSVFTFNVNVANNAPATVTNTASVSGGGEATANNGNNSDSDPTNTFSTPPNVVLVKSCPTPANCTTAPQMPGTDLTYKIEFTNTGGQGAANMSLVDGIPINTDFKIGTAAVNVGTTGLTFVIEYSSNYDPLNPPAATWTYTPVSGGGGASAGYDRNVKAIRWRVTAGTLSNLSPNNVGDISFVSKIR